MIRGRLLPPGADIAQALRVRAAVEARVAAGERVTALTEAPAGGRFARTVDLRKEGASC